MLSDGREFILAGKLTEADIRLFTTIVRFDPVYVTHFKCNIATIRAGYPNIERWLLNLYWKGPNSPAFKETTDFESIKAHYFQSHPQVSQTTSQKRRRGPHWLTLQLCTTLQINPTRIVPIGPLPPINPLK